MSFKIGDKVIVIDEQIKGIIKDIKGNKIIVDTKEGFIIEFTKYELVKIEVEQSEMLKKYSGDFNIQEKQEINKHSKKSIFKSKKQEMGVMEVDLHIQKLVKSTKGMDNFDMLNLQMDTAKHKLEYAIRNRIPKIIFIHGVGEGVLKSELNFLLKRYNVNFYDASYQKYGLGATEVYIYQNKK